MGISCLPQQKEERTTSKHKITEIENKCYGEGYIK